MTPFTFSIRTALKDSWKMFIKHWLFFTGLALVMIVFNLFTNQHHQNPVLMGVVIIAAIVWSYVWISVSLAAVDGKENILNYKSLSVHLPTLRQFFMIVIVGIIVAVIVGVGFILLVIPGLYFMTRLVFANTSFVDKQGSIKQSLEHSWHMVKGKLFWTVFLVLMIEVALVILGSLLLMVGLLIAYPIAMLLMTHLYRALDIHHQKNTVQN